MASPFEIRNSPFAAGARIEIALPGGVTMAFRYCPAGSFRMGQRGEDAREEPVHFVTIPEGFWMGETPVTQAQFAAWKRDHENGFPGKPEHPAENLDWFQAGAFCEWLDRLEIERPEGWTREDSVVRLPGEAEWEYACRAGTETEYHSGDGEAALAEAGWYDGNSGNQTQAVGQKAPNAWGLHDLHGNVWEWCLDVFDGRAYRKRLDGWPVRLWTLDDAGTDAEYWDDDDRREKRPNRVVRGGSWYSTAGNCRAACRDWYWPGCRAGRLGFRLCLARSSAGPDSQASQEEAESGTGGGSDGTERKPQGRDGAVDLSRESLPNRPA